jgi:hypothetical protein
VIHVPGFNGEEGGIAKYKAVFSYGWLV